MNDFWAEQLAKPLLLSLVFTIVGVIVFVFSVWLMQRITPFSIRKEIEEDHNVALGIVMASLILGVAMILAASMIGVSVEMNVLPTDAPTNASP